MNIAQIGKWVLVFAVFGGMACQENQKEPAPQDTEEQGPPAPPVVEGDGKRPENQTPQGGENDRSIITLAPEALEGQFLQTAEVDRRKIAEGVQATAHISPNKYRLAHVSPRIEGKAVKVMAELGDQVKAGERLAILDSIELGYKKSAFRQARTALLVSKANYEREKRLFEQGVSSEKDYLDAQGEYQKSLAAYQAAVEGLELVGLTHEDIQDIIRKKKGHHPLSVFSLTAPQAGTIIERHVTPGELITPNDKPFTIADLTTVWILVDIYEKDLAAVREGADVRLTVDAYPGEVFQGEVVYLGDLVNPQTRTIEARVEIPNPEGRLRPGMFARASIDAQIPDGTLALAVPSDAIQILDEQPMVFVEQQPGIYDKRPVATGAQVPNFVEILSGVKAGERVVTQGSFYLKSILQGEKIGGHAH